MKAFCRAIVAVLLLLPSLAFSQLTPESIAGAKIVGAKEVMKMSQAGALLVDTRTKNEYAELHIKGAHNIPYQEKSTKSTYFDATLDRFDLTKLPTDKNAAIVFYCNAGECWKSFKASTVAVKAGFSNVHWFRGGLPAWKAASLPVE